MALKKSKTLANGISGDYWRITLVSVNRVNKVVTYELSLYISKAARLAGAHALEMRKIFKFTLTNEELAGDLCAIGYSKILTKSNTPVRAPFQNDPLVTVVGDIDLVDAESI